MSDDRFILYTARYVEKINLITILTRTLNTLNKTQDFIQQEKWLEKGNC